MTDQNHQLQNSQAITVDNGLLNVPNNPVIPFIEGDGIGVDIIPVMLKVVDAAVEQAYGDNKKIAWLEVFAGVKATEQFNDETWLPDETLEKINQYKVAIKGPLDAPVGSGVQSLSLKIKQQLNLRNNLKSFHWLSGVPTPVKSPQSINMMLFSEQSQHYNDLIEFLESEKQTGQLSHYIMNDLAAKQFETEEQRSFTLSSFSQQAYEQLVKQAIDFAITHNKTSVTLVHQATSKPAIGNLLKTTGYKIAKELFGAEQLAMSNWLKVVNPNTGEDIVIKDLTLNSMIQQCLTRPAEYQVVVAENEIAEILSSLLNAQTGNIGITPQVNFNENIAVFEACHGTALKYAGLNKVNPSSVILAAELMLRHMGWIKAADKIEKGMSKAIAKGYVTYDLERKVDNATLVSSSQFGESIIEQIKTV